MIKLQFPYVTLPREFVTLLKSSSATTPAAILEIIGPNKALLSILATAFKEFSVSGNEY